MKVKSLSRVRLFATPWTMAHQDPPSVEFSRQEYWSVGPFPSPGKLVNSVVQIFYLYWSVSIVDQFHLPFFSPHYLISLFSCLFACHVVFDWVPDIVNCIFLDAGHFCIFFFFNTFPLLNEAPSSMLQDFMLSEGNCSISLFGFCSVGFLFSPQ